MRHVTVAGRMIGEHYLETSLALSRTHRLAKEKAMYEKEVVDQEAKIEKMKAENKDEYDIKKQASAIYKYNTMPSVFNRPIVFK